MWQFNQKNNVGESDVKGLGHFERHTGMATRC